MMSFLRDFQSADRQFVSEIPAVHINRLVLGFTDNVWGVITFFLALSKFCFVLLQIGYLSILGRAADCTTLIRCHISSCQGRSFLFLPFQATRREQLQLTSLASEVGMTSDTNSSHSGPRCCWVSVSGYSNCTVRTGFEGWTAGWKSARMRKVLRPAN